MTHETPHLRLALQPSLADPIAYVLFYLIQHLPLLSPHAQGAQTATSLSSIPV